MVFGNFDLPIFINSALPAYIAALSTLGLLWVARTQAKRAVDDFVGSNNSRVELATFEYLSGQAELDVKLRKVVKTFPKSADLLKDYVKDDDLAEMRDTLRNHLNKRELMAIGILNGQLNGTFIKKLIGPTILREWKYCEPFIVKEIESDPCGDLYTNYITLAKQWKKQIGN